jgi:hypothetical protein
VFGLLLYFWPDGLVMGGLRNMGAAMRDDQTRFFLVEHITVMLIAVVLAHIGSSRARKGTTDLRKFRAGAIFYTLSALAILIAIPWWRPLLRLG